MTTPAGEPDETAGPPPARVRSSLRRAGVLAVVASFVGIWGYVLYLSVFEGRAEPRDRLDDVVWTETAEATCAPVRSGIDALPLATEVSDPTERAAFLDQATADLAVMVDRLDALVAPASREEADAVAAWLEDWRTYLGDRASYAERFRQGLDEPFRVTDRGGFQIDVLIDDFAHVNFMDSCTTPTDVG